MLKITKLWMDGDELTTAVRSRITGAAAPLFGWTVLSDADGDAQSACRVTVADENTLLWDSGWLNQIVKADLWRRGCIRAYLTTDEYRVPAVCSYLTAGFLPVEYDVDMPQRWGGMLGFLGRINVPMVDEEGNVVRILNECAE